MKCCTRLAGALNPTKLDCRLTKDIGQTREQLFINYETDVKNLTGRTKDLRKTVVD